MILDTWEYFHIKILQFLKKQFLNISNDVEMKKIQAEEKINKFNLVQLRNKWKKYLLWQH